jgi:hypothetical protein
MDGMLYVVIFDYMYTDSTVEMRKRDGILFAHIRGTIQEHSISFIKDELENILDGYPPFYHERMRLLHGPEVPSPIRDVRDITRSG